MAISRIGGASNSAINAGSVTVTLPGSMAVDDLILVAWSCGDDDFTQPTLAMTTAGYTELTTSTLSADGGVAGDGNLAVFYKFHNGTDTTAVTAASGTGTDSSNAVAVQVFRGVATVAQGGPLEVPIQTATGTTGGDPDPPQVSGFDETTAVVVIAGASSKATSSNTFTAPANYGTNFVTVGSAAESFCAAVGLGYNEAPSDPEDPAAMTSTNAAWCAATLVLKEAPAAADVTVTVDTPGTIVWTGQTVTTRLTVPETAGSVAWNGQSVTNSITVPVTAGSVVWNGQTVNTSIAQVVPVTAGAAAWNGQTATTTLSVPVTAASVTWQGQTVNVTQAFVVPVVAGSVTWSGQTVTTRLTTPVSVGAAAWQGQTVNVTIQMVVPVTPGTVVWTGQTVTVNVPSGQVIPVTAGAVLWQGQTVNVSIPGQAGPVSGPTRKVVLVTTPGNHVFDESIIDYDEAFVDYDGLILVDPAFDPGEPPNRSVPIGAGKNSLVEV